MSNQYPAYPATNGHLWRGGVDSSRVEQYFERNPDALICHYDTRPTGLSDSGGSEQSFYFYVRNGRRITIRLMHLPGDCAREYAYLLAKAGRYGRFVLNKGQGFDDFDRLREEADA